MKIPAPGDTALVVLLPEDVSRQIDEWRRVYDPHYKIVPPHITLAFPFIPEHEWPQKRTALDICSKPFQTFDVTLKELKQFTGNPLVLWLKPEDSGNLIRIRTVLEEQFPDYFINAEFAFTPHLTIGFFDSEASLFQTKKEISVELKPMYFKVSELIYMVLSNDNVWRHRDSIYLRRK